MTFLWLLSKRQGVFLLIFPHQSFNLEGQILFIWFCLHSCDLSFILVEATSHLSSYTFDFRQKRVFLWLVSVIDVRKNGSPIPFLLNQRKEEQQSLLAHSSYGLEGQNSQISWDFFSHEAAELRWPLNFSYWSPCDGLCRPKFENFHGFFGAAVRALHGLKKSVKSPMLCQIGQKIPS